MVLHRPFEPTALIRHVESRNSRHGPKSLSIFCTDSAGCEALDPTLSLPWRTRSRDSSSTVSFSALQPWLPGPEDIYQCRKRSRQSLVFPYLQREDAPTLP